MSITGAEIISVMANESSVRIEGKRIVDSIDIEIECTIETKVFSGTERSDWFRGVLHKLTVKEAEILHAKLGRCLDHLRKLEEDGLICLSRE
jgi:hypothetical protein